MSGGDRLQAWLETQGNEVWAGFIGVADGENAPARRPPAREKFASADAARRWVEAEACALGLPLEWIDTPQAR